MRLKKGGYTPMFANNLASPATPALRAVQPENAALVAVSSNNRSAMGVVGMLVARAEIQEWTFQSPLHQTTFRWNFPTRITFHHGDVITGTVSIGRRTRTVHFLLLASEEAAVQATTQTANGLHLNADIVGAGCKFSGEKALRCFFTEIFRQQRGRRSRQQVTPVAFPLAA